MYSTSFSYSLSFTFATCYSYITKQKLDFKNLKIDFEVYSIAAAADIVLIIQVALHWGWWSVECGPGVEIRSIYTGADENQAPFGSSLSSKDRVFSNFPLLSRSKSICIRPFSACHTSQKRKHWSLIFS